MNKTSHQLGPDILAKIEDRMRPGRCSTAGFLGPEERLCDVIRADEETLASLGVSHAQVAQRLADIVTAALEFQWAAGQLDDLLHHPKAVWRQLLRDPWAFCRDTPRAVLNFRRLLGPRNPYDPRSGEPFNLDVFPGVVVEGKFEVRCMGSLGYQDCPFLRVNGTPCPVDEYGCYEFAILNRGTGRRVQFGGLLVHLIGEHRFFEGRQTPYRLDPREVVEVLQLAVDIEQTGGGRKASP